VLVNYIFKLSKGGYSNSDWTRFVDDMKNTIDNCFSFGLRMFSWCSRKQDVVVQSTAKAEYVAVITIVNQAVMF